ncbi:MAG: saccharopine dehydrogenase NADP-binding domain-containing protein [Propionibacteriaceae bacterium]|jgi:hypothetical protein|nr:saccharopine dehydrogenase NADP-binding domain-containing protein [Propionibacteriaceae bacterium]
MKRIGILGGSGETGHIIAELLLARDDVEVVLLGRNEDSLSAVAETLKNSRVLTRVVNATQPEPLREALLDLDLLIVAAPMLNHLSTVAQAALETKTNWLDVLMDSPEKIETLKALSPEFEKEGLQIISGSGIHPGLPGAMIRAIAGTLEPPKGAQVGILMSIDWRKYNPRTETADEFAYEICQMRSGGWFDGEYKTLSWLSPKGLRRIDYGTPFGILDSVVMELEEIRRIREVVPTLDHAAMAMSGRHPVADYFVTPIALLLSKLGRLKAAARFFWWGWTTFQTPPYRTVLIADVWDDSDKMERLTISHEDGYWLTAAVGAATAHQIIDSRIEGLGYHHAALAVEPSQLVEDLTTFGATVKRFSGKQEYGSA